MLVTCDDIDLDKGQGLLILLSGPPGTGKTLLAEASEELLTVMIAHELTTRSRR